MTIQEYLDDLDKMPAMTSAKGKSLRSAMLQSVSIWSNDACRGYVLRALKDADVDTETHKQIMQALHWAMDEMTVGEAEQEYADNF